MSLKKITDFIREDIEPDSNGRKPDSRTVRKWSGAVKIGGIYWIDLDVFYAETGLRKKKDNLLNELLENPEVARLVGNV